MRSFSQTFWEFFQITVHRWVLRSFSQTFWEFFKILKRPFAGRPGRAIITYGASTKYAIQFVTKYQAISNKFAGNHGARTK